MGGVRLRLQPKHLLAVEAVELLGLLGEEAVADDLLRGVVPLLAVEAVLAAKVRDAAFGGDPRPAEKDDVFTLANKFPQAGKTRDLFRHSDSLPFFGFPEKRLSSTGPKERPPAGS